MRAVAFGVKRRPPRAESRRSVSEDAHDLATREHVAAHVEHERGAARLLGHAFELVDVQRVHCERVVMVAVALRRTGTTVRRHTVIARRTLPSRGSVAI